LSALGVGSAMYVAQAADPAAARREMAACNERFLSGLGLRLGDDSDTDSDTDSETASATDTASDMTKGPR
ncbi:MAG: hypothetical protein ACRDYE_16080, partial [Acidimicrobiales bacterium]